MSKSLKWFKSLLSHPGKFNLPPTFCLLETNPPMQEAGRAFLTQDPGFWAHSSVAHSRWPLKKLGVAWLNTSNTVYFRFKKKKKKKATFVRMVPLSLIFATADILPNHFVFHLNGFCSLLHGDRPWYFSHKHTLSQKNDGNWSAQWIMLLQTLLLRPKYISLLAPECMSPHSGWLSQPAQAGHETKSPCPCHPIRHKASASGQESLSSASVCTSDTGVQPVI